jgi:hypothetical protein
LVEQGLMAYRHKSVAKEAKGIRGLGRPLIAYASVSACGGTLKQCSAVVCPWGSVVGGQLAAVRDGG